MLQAMGLGGWMFNGMDPFSVLGASGNPAVPGLGFRFDADERWPYPNSTGLTSVMEGCCPPHFRDMRAAVDALCERKFGSGGPFHPDTPGPWNESRKIRAAAPVHSEEFKECVALQTQYIFDRFGEFPGTVRRERFPVRIDLPNGTSVTSDSSGFDRALSTRCQTGASCAG